MYSELVYDYEYRTVTPEGAAALLGRRAEGQSA